MEKKPEVLLYGLTVGSGLIVAYPSGIVFTNQTGGVRCCQDSLEGFFVPLELGDPLDEGSPVGVAAEALGIFYPSARDEVSDRAAIDRIDGALVAAGHGYLRVTRDRWRESREAWLWLTISEGYRFLDWQPIHDPEDDRDAYRGERRPPPLVTGAVLTWRNSD